MFAVSFFHLVTTIRASLARLQRIRGTMDEDKTQREQKHHPGIQIILLLIFPWTFLCYGVGACVFGILFACEHDNLVRNRLSMALLGFPGYLLATVYLVVVLFWRSVKMLLPSTANGEMSGRASKNPIGAPAVFGTIVTIMFVFLGIIYAAAFSTDRESVFKDVHMAEASFAVLRNAICSGGFVYYGAPAYKLMKNKVLMPMGLLKVVLRKVVLVSGSALFLFLLQSVAIIISVFLNYQSDFSTGTLIIQYVLNFFATLIPSSIVWYFFVLRLPQTRARKSKPSRFKGADEDAEFGSTTRNLLQD
jgi:hypothetical protein